MTSLSQSLQPYKETVGFLASVVTIALYFAGTPICYEIYKNKSTKGKSSMPFVGGLGMGILILKYAIMLNDKAMFQCNVVAIALNILFTIAYTVYSQSRWDEVYKLVLYCAGLIAAIFSYLQVESPEKIEFRYGLIITILSLLLLGSPLLEVKEIIEKKDASSIPFPIVFMSEWVSILWFVYGIILENVFTVIQNIVGMVLCALQLYLHFRYPSGGRLNKKNR